MGFDINSIAIKISKQNSETFLHSFPSIFLTILDFSMANVRRILTMFNPIEIWNTQNITHRNILLPY